MTERALTSRAPKPWRRPLVAAALVLVAYGALTSLMSSGGSLGADTGAKVATLEVMNERGSWRPEVGYWAARWDPDASIHGLQQTQPIGDDFVVVTTLPMLLAGHPLYDFGGYKLALVLPMLGGLGVAFGCRALARRLADENVGWVVFWVTALGSPIVLYSLDFWEHAPGAALMVWGVVHALDVALERDRPWTPLAVGALLGAAATLRSEAFVVTLVAVSAACLAVVLARRSLVRPMQVGLLAVAGFGGPWFANVVLEGRLVDPGDGAAGLDRTTRAQGLLGGAGVRAGDRLQEGLTTLFATYSSSAWLAILSGALAVGLLLVAVHRAPRGDRAGGVAAAVASTALIGLPALDGLGWVPGGWVAFPAAGLGLLALTHAGALRWTVVACLVAYPVTWASQYLEAALPQWGGRYALTITLVLGTCGLCAVATMGRDALLVAVVPCVMVTAVGIAWMSYRTHEIDRLFDQLVERPEDVVFAKYGVFVREGMAAYDERLWLAAGHGTDAAADLAEATELVEDAGLHTIGVLDESAGAPAAIGRFDLMGEIRYDVAGVILYLHSYSLGE